MVTENTINTASTGDTQAAENPITEVSQSSNSDVYTSDNATSAKQSESVFVTSEALSITEIPVVNESIVSDTTDMIITENSVSQGINLETIATEITQNSIVTEVTSILSETIAETTVSSDVPQQDNNSSANNGSTLLLGAAIIAGLLYVYNKYKKPKTYSENSAKKKDQLRLSKLNESKKKKSSAGKSKKDKKISFKMPKTVHETMPYKQVLSNDIWLIAPKTYSKAYTFSDINYNLGDEDQQFYCLESYCNFLNTLDDNIDCQVCMYNNSININDLEKDLLIASCQDNFIELRNEYNTRILKENISKGQNGIQKKLYLTLTIKTADEDYAQKKFKTLDLELKNSFDRIGNTDLKVLSSQERVEVLKDIFIGSNVKIPILSEDDFDNKLDKVYCSPDYFEFKKDYFMYNDIFAKVIFIKEYPSRANDSILTDLMNTNLKMVVTTNVIAHDPAKARKLVQKQITAIETNMAQRESKAAQHGNFSSQMPVRIKNQIDGYKKLHEKIRTCSHRRLSNV